MSAADQPQRDPLDAHLLAALAGIEEASFGKRPLPEGSLTPGQWLALFGAQAQSRHLDFAARALRAQGIGFYTIGSSGHEANAIVAAALRRTDPALLHYRSGGFYLSRALQLPGHDGVRDVLLGLLGSADEPIAGGRHKVFGHHDLAVIPQTSTIGSHLPRAVGTAFALDRAAKLGVPTAWPADSVVITSFGDASANHSTTVGAINATCWATYQGMPMPLLLVCEDNGIGISVRTPTGWIAAAYSQRPGLRYLAADGTDPVAAYATAHQAAQWVRRTRKPAFLHLRTVRFGAHAGSDVESSYRTPAEISADYAADPLLATARLLVGAGAARPAQLIERYEAARTRVQELAEELGAHPNRLATAAQVMAPLAPRTPQRVRELATTAARGREEIFGATLPEDEGPLTLAQAINRTLLDAAASYPELIVYGEDVGRKGGVYGVTRGLQRRLGPARVFDTLLDEQTILGLGLGGGMAGLLPVPEIQYLAYVHNAADQLRGEAATLSYFSQGRYRNPMVVRIAGYGYQKGFGGHFHNDDSIAALRDIPGLVIATPAHAADAPAMLRSCLAAAQVNGTVTAFIEPIALYHTRDLHRDGDGQWLAAYPPPAQWPERDIPIGRAARYGEGSDLVIMTFGNGLYMSLRAAQRLAEAGIHARVLDLRWLAPLPIQDMIAEAHECGRVLVADETRRTGGVGEGVLAELLAAGFAGPMRRVSSEDSFIPLGDAAELVLLSEADIEKAATELVHG